MKKNIKRLLLESKTRGKLDINKIKKNITFLTRTELKEYLMLLREERGREKVVIQMPVDQRFVGKSLKSFFKRKFKNKELEFIENKALLGGIRIEDNDNVLDYSFKNILEQAL